MFHCGRWAAAFVNSLEKEDGDTDEGLEFLKVLASWVKELPGDVFGSYAAEMARTLAYDAISKAGAVSVARETAIRFIELVIKKNRVRYIDDIVKMIKSILDKKHGVIEVFAEYAFPADADTEARIIEELKKQTGAVRIDLTGRIEPSLIGGYRLRIGDEIIDASVRLQLRKLLEALQSGQVDAAGGGN